VGSNKYYLNQLGSIKGTFSSVIIGELRKNIRELMPNNISNNIDIPESTKSYYVDILNDKNYAFTDDIDDFIKNIINNNQIPTT
jgi:hypothetical protein